MASPHERIGLSRTQVDRAGEEQTRHRTVTALLSAQRRLITGESR